MKKFSKLCLEPIVHYSVHNSPLLTIFRGRRIQLAPSEEIYLRCIPICRGGERHCENRPFASSCMSVYLSARNNWSATARIFSEIFLLCILIQIRRLNLGLIRSNVNNEHLIWRPAYIHINISPFAKHVRDMQLSERPKKQLKILSLTCSCLRGRRNSLKSYLWHAALWEAEEIVEDIIFAVQLSERPKK